MEPRSVEFLDAWGTGTPLLQQSCSVSFGEPAKPEQSKGYFLSPIWLGKFPPPEGRGILNPPD